MSRSREPSLVICILAGSSCGVTCDTSWERLVRESDGQIALALYSNTCPTNTTFWTPFWANHINIHASWGDPSLVTIEVELYAWALGKYPDARRLLLVSGDSLPLKPCASLLRELELPSSIYWYGEEEHFPGMYWHSAWKGLTRADAMSVCENWEEDAVPFLRQIEQANLIRKDCVCSNNSIRDEWAIGTLLVRGGKVSVQEASEAGGRLNMFQEMGACHCPMCGGRNGRKTVFRATELTAEKLTEGRSQQDNYLFARKVTRNVFERLFPHSGPEFFGGYTSNTSNTSNISNSITTTSNTRTSNTTTTITTFGSGATLVQTSGFFKLDFGPA